MENGRRSSRHSNPPAWMSSLNNFEYNCGKFVFYQADGVFLWNITLTNYSSWLCVIIIVRHFTWYLLYYNERFKQKRQTYQHHINKYIFIAYYFLMTKPNQEAVAFRQTRRCMLPRHSFTGRRMSCVYDDGRKKQRKIKKERKHTRRYYTEYTWYNHTMFVKMHESSPTAT